MHVDLMHVLYAYSRVMGGGGGGGGYNKYSRGQVHACICGILDIYKTHTVRAGACMQICIWSAGVYIHTYGTRGVWGGF